MPMFLIYKRNMKVMETAAIFWGKREWETLKLLKSFKSINSCPGRELCGLTKQHATWLKRQENTTRLESC